MAEPWKEIFMGVLCYPNPIREKRMRAQWKALGWEDHVWMSPGIDLTDPRVRDILKDDDVHRPDPDGMRRNFSITWGHLDMIRRFVSHSSYNYAIFCENDIVVSKTLEQDVAWALERIKAYPLDILLLGFLNSVAPGDYPDRYAVHPASDSTPDRTLFCYPDDHWGVQMYMITRNYAQRLLDTYTAEFVRKSWRGESGVPAFSPDHTLSKLASFDRRAFLFPMAAIEDGTTSYEHGGQHHFHQASFHMYYAPERYFPPNMGEEGTS